MANADKPNGFRFAYTLHGGPPSIGVYKNTAAIIYPGDHVMLDGGGRVAVNTASNPGMGVANNYVSATSGQDVYVYNDLKNTIFQVQADEDDLSNDTVIGLYYDILYTGGSTVTHQGQMELDTNASVDDNLELMGLVDRPDNAWGTNCDVYVRFHVDTQIQVAADTT